MTTINAMQRFFLVVFLISLSFLSACSHYKFPWVYRIDVEQGNIIDQDKVAQLKIGMTQSQVKFLLGTPLIQDTFDQSRWDYFYSLRTGKGVYDRKRLTLTFNGNALANIEELEYETRELIY